MSDIKLFKDEDGNILQTNEFEPIDRQYITDKIQHLSFALQRWHDALAEYDRLTGTDTTEDKPAETPDGMTAVDDGDGHITFIKVDTPEQTAA